MRQKCNKCGEVKEDKDFAVHRQMKSGLSSYCKKCKNKGHTNYRNTEHGYLRDMYYGFGFRKKCHFIFEEFMGAFKKHTNIYGMRSAWGPGPDQLEKHLPMTMFKKGKGQQGQKGPAKGTKIIASMLSVDRLDSTKDYTLQNIIFIRNDENMRKKDTSYEDCKIHMRLHEERFIKMKAL